MVTQQTLDDYAESDFLTVAKVQDGDLIKVLGTMRKVESFGKEKLQLDVEFNGHRKFMNINKVQARQLKAMVFDSFPVTLVLRKTLFDLSEGRQVGTLNFEPLTEKVGQ